jgi:hypothetical protein
MAAATQIVVCRVLLEHEPMPTNPPFTINVLLKRARGRKRSRPGIAKVQVMLNTAGTTPNPVLTGDEPVGICVYDRKARSCADVTMLVKGVAEIECTQAAMNSYGPYAEVIKVVEKRANGINVYRAFFDFSERYPDGRDMTITAGAGIEASENHLVQTLNFHDVAETALGNYQVGMPVAKDQEIGIMLWPLSTKSIGKGPSNPYAKAAVLTRGVATLYIENAHAITPLTRGSVVYNGLRLRVAVLEVYQSSIRVQILVEQGGVAGEF